MLEYLQEHILEEIDGAVDYWTKAVEHKNDEWGILFRQMANMEIEHANVLTKIFSKTPKSNEITDKDYAEMYKKIMDSYTHNMSKIENLKKMYWAE